MTTLEIAKKIVLANCLDWSDEKKTNLIKAIDKALEDFGIDEYQEGMRAANED